MIKATFSVFREGLIDMADVSHFYGTINKEVLENYNNEFIISIVVAGKTCNIIIKEENSEGCIRNIYLSDNIALEHSKLERNTRRVKLKLYDMINQFSIEYRV